LAQAFKVQAYPTLIFCPMKGNPQMAKGALPKAQLVEIINQLLLKKQVTPPPPFLQRR
jgi:thioredoxin-related protein